MNEIELVVKAIWKINENAQMRIVGETLENCTIEWIVGNPISKADIEAKMAELPTEEEERTARENLKASAKAKLIAGQPLTEEEANTIIL